MRIDSFGKKCEAENELYKFDDELKIWTRDKYAGIDYSDGDEAEQRIARIIDQASDISVFSTELRQHCTDWPSLYHLSGSRANVLRPFENILNGDVLEIGAGCGAITRYLGECGVNILALEGSPRRATIARSRTRDLENVTILAESFDQFTCNHQFDVITLIGVLEYANLYISGENPPLAMLERVQSLLKPEGRLIIAIENQLGLKYFAGAPEDHLGKPMIGIEGHYGKNQPQTFGRKVLSDMLEQAGFSVSEFLTPFPDYKLPVSILTEEGINNKKFDAAAFAWQSARRDPQLPPYSNFSIELAWPEVFRNAMALEVANSFLIIASPNHRQLIDRRVLAYHYTTERFAAYCKEAVFTLKDDGDILVRYKRLGRANGDGVTNSMGKPLVRFICPDQDEYVMGMPLSLELIRIVTKDGWVFDQVARFIWHYLSIIETFVTLAGMQFGVESPYTEVSGDFLDAIPQNIILRKDGAAALIDKEWVIAGPIEVAYLIFRALILLLNSITRFGRPASGGDMSRKQFIYASFAAAGLELQKSDYDRYVRLEAWIQQAVTGRATEEFLNWAKDQPLPMLNLSQALAERDGQIASLNQAVTERDEQIASLDQAVTERDEQIASLNQAVTERDEQIASLNQNIAERDEQTANLNQTIVERDGQIADIYHSKSWRVTRPLRAVRQLADLLLDPFFWRFMRNTYIAIRDRVQRHGVAGFIRRLPYYLRHYRTHATLLAVSPATVDDGLFNAPPPIPFDIRLHPDLVGVDEYIDASISIVIPTLNAGPEFLWLLRKLRAQRGLNRLEIVIVDSGSRDGTTEIARAAGCNVIEIPPSDFSHSYARNAGADAAQSDYLIFMVQDAYPIGDYWAYGMLRYLLDHADEKLIAVSCSEYSRSDSDMMYDSMINTHYRFLGCLDYDRIGEYRGDDHKSLRTCGQLSDVACLISHATFARYRFHGDYAEDLDLGIRLIKDGYRVAMLSSIKVVHSHNRPAYYYLMRSFVDVIFLTGMFDDFICPHIDTVGGLMMGIVSTAGHLSGWLANYDETGSERVLQEELGDWIRGWRKDFAGLCLDTPSRLGDQRLDTYIDSLVKRYLPPTDKKPDIKALEAARHFLDTFLARLEHFNSFAGKVYGAQDALLRRELRDVLCKTFAATAGSALGFMYMNFIQAEGVERYMAETIYNELKTGI